MTEVQEKAQAYIDKVLESQRELGVDAEISDKDYQRAVDRAAQAFTEIAEPAADEEEEAVPA